MIETRARLRLAYMNALASPDPSSQNGAVATRGGRVVGQGCNDFPPGVEQTPERWNDKPTKYALVIHAEIAALLDALLHGEQPDTIYCVWITCSECAKTMIAAGVKRVVGHAARSSADPASWSDSRKRGIDTLTEARVEVELYDEPIDAAPIRVSGELWDPSKGA